MAEPIHVLHVEDDPDFASVTAQFLERECGRLDVEAATDPETALSRLETDSVDCVISDYDMPGMDGVELLEAVRDLDPEVPFILFTGKGSEEVASEALAKGATDYLQKATGTDQYTLLANRIENAVGQHHSIVEYERQREILQTAQELADLGVCEIDVETGDIWVSEGMIGVFDAGEFTDGGDVPDRMDPEEMLTFYHPDDRDTMRAAVRRAVETGTSADLEVRLNTEDERWARVRFTPVEGEPETSRVRGAIQDVTDRKQRERELGRTQRRFEAVFEDPEMLVGVLDLDGRLCEANDTSMSYVEADREDVVGEPFHETPWWDEDVRGDVREWVEQAADGEYVTFEADLTNSDGAPFVVEGSIRPVTDDGEITSLIVSARDVTERTSSRTERDFFETLVAETTDIITVIGEDGAIEFANDALERQLGYDPDAVGGEAVAGYAHPDDQDALVDWFTNAIADPETDPGSFEFRIQHAEGGWRWLEAVARDHLSSAIEGYVVTSRDITGRKERERELEHYETVIEELGENTFVTNAEAEYTYANAAGDDIAGYAESELIGRPADFLYGDEEFEDIAEAVVDLAMDDEREVTTLESTIQTKSGEELPIEITMTVRYDEDGEFAGTIGVATDISDRLETERELQEHESILRAIPDEIAVMDTDGHLEKVIPPTGAETTVTGYEVEEMEGEHIGMVMPDEALEESIELIMDLVESDRNRGTIEHELVAKDGDRLLHEAHVALLTDDDRNIEGSVSILRDIEERKERERELREYESIVRAMPDEVVVLDTDGHIQRAIPPTDKETTASGYPPEDLEGRHVTDVMTDEDAETGAELIAELIETDRERAAFEMEVVTRDDERLLREDHLALLEGDDGLVQGTVGVLRDIEERKAYERELERQNERLEQFASIASHDLRNPLNLAQGYMEMVEDACDVEHTEKVADSLDRMEQLIDDTLTWARQGSTVSERKPVDLGSLAPDAWEAVGSEAATLDVVDDVTVEGDPSRVRQVVENLLRNAVEHGGEDVHVEIGAIDGDDPVGTGDAGQTGTGDAGRAGFYVADDGPGIPPDQRDSVFEAGFTTASDGTGFGLAIIGEICDAHGWDIGVTGSESGGARFEITGVNGGT